mmetsp:Transcript_10983/g.30089  ORF Transcript_10983/g.30089 Transcript_10983/m.30089 type:complete len:154 (+) Transcript_10983:72-533(+)
MALRTAVAFLSVVGFVVADPAVPGSSVSAKVQAMKDMMDAAGRHALVATATETAVEAPAPSLPTVPKTNALAERIVAQEYLADVSDLDGEVMRGADDAAQANLQAFQDGMPRQRGALLAASTRMASGASRQARAAHYFETHGMKSIGRVLHGQ